MKIFQSHYVAFINKLALSLTLSLLYTICQTVETGSSQKPISSQESHPNMAFIGSKRSLQKINKNNSRLCENILFFDFYGQISDFFITLTKKNRKFIFSENCHFQMVARNHKNDRHFLDLALQDVSAKDEVDRTFSQDQIEFQ